MSAEDKPRKLPAVEQADGVSKNKNGYHQFLKKRKNKLERRAAKQNPEVQPGYGKYKGYET